MIQILGTRCVFEVGNLILPNKMDTLFITSKVYTIQRTLTYFVRGRTTIYHLQGDEQCDQTL